MITTATKYDYPASGGYADTIATLEDGRRVAVNTQYACVDTIGQLAHTDDCGIRNMGGHCTCGHLDGIDIAALVADARVNGKRGVDPEIVARREADREARETANDAEYARLAADPTMCPRCGSRCYGDCRS